MIEEAHVSFETAKLLKEKGFPQEYDRYHALVYNEEDYENEYEVQRMVLETEIVKAGTLSSYSIGVPEPKCYCPTQQMVMRWLREVHNIYMDIAPTHSTNGPIDFIWQTYNSDYLVTGDCDIFYPTYEEAVEEAIQYSLEHLI